MSGQQIEQLLNKLEFLVTLINKNELFPFTARDQECVSGVLSERDPSGQYHCPLSDPVDPELTIRVSCPHCPEGSELASSLVYAAIKRGILLIAMEICRVQFHPELDSNLPDSLKTLLSSIAKIANGSTHTSDRATSRTGSSMDSWQESLGGLQKCVGDTPSDGYAMCVSLSALRCKRLFFPVSSSIR